LAVDGWREHVRRRHPRQPATANRQPVPVIQAFNVRNELPDTDTTADYILFDTGGGTGRTFDWSLLASYPRTKPFFLAGGITPDNAEEAIAKTQPFAIDLASGVERAPGIKDHDKMKRLFEAISR
ncbi:MAG: phosphoribosylanthranilate isomerase, partial [Thermoanaerobaculia bacterium]